MFLVDEERIINTALVERFGFAPDGENLLTADYHFKSRFVNGRVIAEFRKGDLRTWEVLYEGNAEACQEFYGNLLKALVQGDRAAAIEDLHPVKPD